ncbi:MAG: HEAT repeat domain-containing protein [Chloroflexi bacterium]|nr:HEAT repeat domain-containing protein [Chloroflexota bacterium]
MTLERLFGELSDEGKSIRNSVLVRLSGLLPEELEQLPKEWPRLSSIRRSQILKALVDMGETNPELDFTSLFKFCLKDPEPEIREKAIAGLWECEERGLIFSFIAIMKEDPSEKVRAVAARALGNFSRLAESGRLLRKDGERVRQALLDVIQQLPQSVEVRRRALEAVAPFNDSDIKTIIKDAYSSPDDLLRQSSLKAMGRNGDGVWLPTILKELKSDDPTMRQEAASAVGAVSDEGAIPYLIPLLQDEDTEVRLATVRALGETGGRMAKRALAACLRSEEEPVREAAAEALRRMDSDEDPLSFGFRT